MGVQYSRVQRKSSGEDLHENVITSVRYYNPRKLINHELAPKICDRCSAHDMWFFIVEFYSGYYLNENLNKSVKICAKCYAENPQGTIADLTFKVGINQIGDENVCIQGYLINNYDCLRCQRNIRIRSQRCNKLDCNRFHSVPEFNGFFQNDDYYCLDCVNQVKVCDECEFYIFGDTCKICVQNSE